MVEIMKKELRKTANGIINVGDLNKIKINFIKSYQQERSNNDYDVQLLSRYFR